MKNFLKLLPCVVFLSSCLHAPPNYPGAKGSTINQDKYANASCPDFSGSYEAVGQLIDGDATAQQIGRIMFFDGVFPIYISSEWENLRKNYREEGPNRIYVRPDFADVKALSNRSILVTMRYKDGPVGSYHSNFTNQAKFVCADGRLMWGSSDNVVSHSEFGKNTGDRSFTIYADHNGDLIYEQRQQVHMNLALGIPAGTAKYFAIYRFKKLLK